jgi:hypothetical protein
MQTANSIVQNTALASSQEIGTFTITLQLPDNDDLKKALTFWAKYDRHASVEDFCVNEILAALASSDELIEGGDVPNSVPKTSPIYCAWCAERGSDHDKLYRPLE